MYVIAGITGNTGGAAARALIAAGQSVRGLTRDASKATEWAGQAEVVELELTDTAALTAALTGAKGAYLLVPPHWTTPDFGGYAATIIASITEAVRASGVERVVLLSSIGAELPEGTGPIRVLHTLEGALAEQPGLTFVRPAYFQENIGGFLEPASQGTLPVYLDPDSEISMVATRDIGAEIARQLLIPADRAELVVQLAGPQEYSFSQVAAALGQALGREVQPLQLPPDAIIEPLRQTGAGQIAELYAEMNQALEEGLLHFDPSLPLHRGPTRLADTLAAMTAG